LWGCRDRRGDARVFWRATWLERKNASFGGKNPTPEKGGVERSPLVPKGGKGKERRQKKKKTGGSNRHPGHPVVAVGGSFPAENRKKKNTEPRERLGKGTNRVPSVGRRAVVPTNKRGMKDLGQKGEKTSCGERRGMVRGKKGGNAGLVIKGGQKRVRVKTI